MLTLLLFKSLNLQSEKLESELINKNEEKCLKQKRINVSQKKRHLQKYIFLNSYIKETLGDNL